MSPLIKTARQASTASTLGRAYEELANHLFSRCVDQEAETTPLGVTSIESKAGKSTIAKNLAIASARAGIHTLLIASRRPFDDQVDHGKSPVSLHDVQKGTEWVEAVHATQHPDLFFAIYENQLPPRETHDFESLKRALMLRFERVIVDLPSIDAVAEQPLSHWLSNAIVVVVPGTVDHQDALAARRTLDAIGMQNLGVILSGA